MSTPTRAEALHHVAGIVREARDALRKVVGSAATRESLDEALRDLALLTKEKETEAAQATLGLDADVQLEPEPLELDRLADLQQPLHDVDLASADGERLTDHLDDLNVLFEVSANALGATTVDELLQRVVDGARRVTGARLASAGYGYHAGVFQIRATSTPGEQSASEDRGVLSAEPREVVLELLERRHSIRLTNAELPHEARRAGGLVGARLVGREGETDGHILVFDKSDGDFRAEDEALLSQLAAFTSLGLQHIQARGEAEARFAEAEEGRSILRAIMEHVPEGIAVADGPDATVRMMSRFGQQMIGRTPAEIQSTQVDKAPLRWRVFHVADNALASPEQLPLTRAIQEGRTVIDEEWLVEDRKGTKSFALFNAGPIKDRSGAVTGGVAVWRDITQRKKAEAELMAAKERLIRQEKLAYLGALAGGVGHELRTPLGSIANAAFFLRMVNDDPSPETEEAIDILQREVGTAESIITALLDFSRPRPPRREEVDIDELLASTLSKLEVPESVAVCWSHEAKGPVMVDPRQMAQVFGNILTNALQAMPDGGELTIDTRTLPTQEVCVSISDTGPGVATEHIGELFEPLFTTKARGIGLGLSVAQTLVRRHGGTIDVKSTKGQGTTFAVRLKGFGSEGDVRG